MFLFLSLAERAERKRAKGPESKGKRWGWRWRVWWPGVSAAIRRGLRQGLVQDETQPQAYQQPELRLKQRATGHKAQLLSTAEVVVLTPPSPQPSPWVDLTCTFLCTLLHSHPARLPHRIYCRPFILWEFKPKVVTIQNKQKKKGNSSVQDLFWPNRTFYTGVECFQQEKHPSWCKRCSRLFCAGFFVRHSLCTDWNVELIDSFGAWCSIQTGRLFLLQGAILYGLKSQIERHAEGVRCPEAFGEKLNLNFILTLLLSCIQNHHGTEMVRFWTGVVSNARDAAERQFSIHHYWRAAFIYIWLLYVLFEDFFVKSWP